MKANKSLLAVLSVLILFVGACQPQAMTSTSASEPSTEPASSPEAEASSEVKDSSLNANLSELTGKVELKQDGEAAFTPASEDSQLKVNGQVQTGEDGRVRLDLSSGTIIRVAPSSLFTLTSNEEVEGGLATKFNLELGKIFIILSGGSAEVNTPSGVAAVQGSYLKIEFDPITGDIYLTCLEGNCSASNPAGTINFTNGQKVVLFHKDPVTGNWSAPNVENMTPEDFQEWLDANPEAKALFDQAVAGGGLCFNTIQPAAGSRLPAQGRIEFEWEPQPGAAKYIIKFTNADGTAISFETTDPNLQGYIESFLPGKGDISWDVTAINASGAPICTTAPSIFTKPDSNWSPEEKEKKEKEKQPSTCTYCNL